MKLIKRAAQQLQNPKLLSISFKSFRHWGGSMLAHYTDGNMLKIQKALRHKSITNTMKYIHTLEFRDEDFEVTTATTVEQIMELGKAGWVKYDELTLNGSNPLLPKTKALQQLERLEVKANWNTLKF